MFLTTSQVVQLSVSQLRDVWFIKKTLIEDPRFNASVSSLGKNLGRRSCHFARQ
jgi:hypothetical protein